MDRRAWRRVLGVGLFFVLVAGVSGCDLIPHSTIPERQPETGKPIASSYRFDDIPIPERMILARKES